MIDSTGLVALDNAIGALLRRRGQVVSAGPLPRPQGVFDKAHLPQKHPELHIAPSLEVAIPMATRLAEAALGLPPGTPPNRLKAKAGYSHAGPRRWSWQVRAGAAASAWTGRAPMLREKAYECRMVRLYLSRSRWERCACPSAS